MVEFRERREDRVYGRITPDGIEIYGKASEHTDLENSVIYIDASGMDGQFAGTVEKLEKKE
jgi:hypothetical protein